MAELPALEKFYRLESARTNVFVVVQPSNAGSMLKLMADGANTVPAMIDKAGLARSYGVRAVPTLVVLDEHGSLATTIVGQTDLLQFSRVLDDLTG